MPIPLRTDFDASQVRAAAKATKDGPQVRRLLALAAIYDGGTRGKAARIGGVMLQIGRLLGGAGQGSARTVGGMAAEIPCCGSSKERGIWKGIECFLGADHGVGIDQQLAGRAVQGFACEARGITAEGTVTRMTLGGFPPLPLHTLRVRNLWQLRRRRACARRRRQVACCSVWR